MKYCVLPSILCLCRDQGQRSRSWFEACHDGQGYMSCAKWLIKGFDFPSAAKKGMPYTTISLKLSALLCSLFQCKATAREQSGLIRY